MEKNNKTLNVPHLRFLEFSGEWEKTSIGDCCSDLEYGMNAASKNFDGVNKYIRITDIDELTAEYKQDSLVSPDALLEDKYLVKDGDILFARTGASTGKTYIYAPQDGKLYYAGFLIRANVNFGTNPKFVFYQTQTHRYKKWVSIMSMRSGQPGINSQEYASYQFWKPTKEEQDKISDLISLLDQRIKTQKKIIEKCESLIRGLITYVNKGEVWKCKATALRDVLTEVHEKNVENYEVCSVSVSQGVINQIDYLGRSFAAKEVLHYNVVHYGDLVYTKSPTGEFPFGIVKRSNLDRPVAVSPLYGVYRPVNDTIGIYLHLYFKSPVYTKNYLHSLIQKGAKNTINITNQHFLNNKIQIPEPNVLEIFVHTASEIEKKIQAENRVLTSLEKQKNYLLSKMFI